MAGRRASSRAALCRARGAMVGTAALVGSLVLSCAHRRGVGLPLCAASRTCSSVFVSTRPPACGRISSELEHRVEMHPQIKSATVRSGASRHARRSRHRKSSDRLRHDLARLACRSTRMVAFSRSTRVGSRSICRCSPRRTPRSCICSPDVRSVSPALFGEISDIRRTGGTGHRSHAYQPHRFGRSRASPRSGWPTFIPVEADLARRKARVTELDLRFRDQVIARTQ